MAVFMSMCHQTTLPPSPLENGYACQLYINVPTAWQLMTKVAKLTQEDVLSMQVAQPLVRFSPSYRYLRVQNHCRNITAQTIFNHFKLGVRC